MGQFTFLICTNRTKMKAYSIVATALLLTSVHARNMMKPPMSGGSQQVCVALKLGTSRSSTGPSNPIVRVSLANMQTVEFEFTENDFSKVNNVRSEFACKPAGRSGINKVSIQHGGDEGNAWQFNSVYVKVGMTAERQFFLNGHVDFWTDGDSIRTPDCDQDASLCCENNAICELQEA